MNKIHQWYLQFCLALFGLGVSMGASAVVPAYVSTALTNAQTTLTEYIEAAAPFLFAVTIVVSAIFLIVRFIKRAAS